MKFDVADWVEGNLDIVRRSGDERVCVCPFCGKREHFYVNVETGSFICFSGSCAQSGSGFSGLIRLIAQVEEISQGEARAMLARTAVTFRPRRETTESLADRVGALRDRSFVSPPPHDIEAELPEEFIPVWNGKKWAFPSYLKERGFTRELCRDWGLGFCRTGRYAGRIVIPIVCPNGKSFTARDTTGAQHPRYLNPKGVDHGRLLVGWSHAPLEGDVVLVEGPLDALMLAQHGIPALAILGNRLKPQQFNLLYKRPEDAAVIVMLDPGEVETPFRVAAQLLTRFRHVLVARLKPSAARIEADPSGMSKLDPGCCTKDEALAAVRTAQPYKGEHIRPMHSLLDGLRERAKRFS